MRKPFALNALIWTFFVLLNLRASADVAQGEKIYRDQCARCHGANGEGTEDSYPTPLVGDRSIAQLAALISETMPEDTEEKCSAADSRLVAEYIYTAFYSPEAQFRDKPARVELSRLTVRQHQNALADLIDSFRARVTVAGEPGLVGRYFAARDFRPQSKLIERVDPNVRFQFGEGPPDANFEPNNFSIMWEGSILAPDTGDYEFIVRTENACRLFVNDRRTPLIDAWVKSGDDKEFRGEIRLLGGKAYPIRLAFSKSRQGVGDSQQPKDDAKATSSIVLEWRRPFHTVEVIPQRNLMAASTNEVFILSTPFPPDDRSVGYERGTSVSKTWDEATTEAAIETADYVVKRLTELTGIKEDLPDREIRLIDFCHTFAERAFRRPLTDEQRLLYVDRQFAEEQDPDVALKRVILLLLKSPRFLYREIGDEPANDPHDIVSRMAFGLWDSIPDDPLRNAAKLNFSVEREPATKILNRMAADPRATSKLRNFLLTWLRVSDPPNVSKDPALFPQFTPEVLSDLRTSLELSLDELLQSESSSFQQLLREDSVYLNGRLAAIYDVELPKDAPFTKVRCQPDYRTGIVAHPYLLSCFAYANATSPIHRGVFLSRNVLGRTLRQPPEAVAPLPLELHADLTTRERVNLQTQPPMCQTCHTMINPLGFSLEEFDAIGRYRSSEKSQPIDASGSYIAQSGQLVQFDGATQLAAFLAASEEAQAAFVQQLFQYLVKQPIRAYGPDCWQQLQKSFAENNFNIRKLAVEIVATSALHSN